MSDDTIRVNRITIQKKDFERMPEEDRNLFFMFGHISNELSIIKKMHWFSSNYEFEANSIFDHAHTSQNLLFAKMLAGKATEAWNFIRAIFLSTPIGKKFVPLLDEEGEQALTELKQYFGKQTFLKKVRNDFAFHYLTSDWSRRLTVAYEKIGDEECKFYISRSGANTHWYGADVVVNYSLLETVNEDDIVKAMDQFISELIDVVALLTKFIDYCMVSIIREDLGFEFISDKMEPVTIRGAPDPKKISLPFFVQVPETV